MWPSQEVRERERELGWFRLSPFPFSLSALPKSGEEGLFLFPRRPPPPPSPIQSEDGGDSAERRGRGEEKIKQESHPRLCEEEEIL